MKKFFLISLLAVAALTGSASAQVIDGAQGVHAVRRFLIEYCASPGPLTCVEWEIESCFRHGPREVKCPVLVETVNRRHRDYLEACYFPIFARLHRDGYIYTSIGQVRCYNRRGEYIHS